MPAGIPSHHPTTSAPERRVARADRAQKLTQTNDMNILRRTFILLCFVLALRRVERSFPPVQALDQTVPFKLHTRRRRARRARRAHLPTAAVFNCVTSSVQCCSPRFLRSFCCNARCVTRESLSDTDASFLFNDVRYLLDTSVLDR
jgi:hypothetical protein